MRLAWIKIGLFVAVVGAPLIGIAVFGPVEPYGNVAKLAEFPATLELLSTQRGVLDRFAAAILARSAVRRTSIELKNLVSADFIQFVDTPRVVSGTAGWLFLKDELWPECLDEATLRPAIANLELIADMGRAAGIAVVVSIAPDKATIYPSYLHPFARRYWRCKSAGSSLLRRLLAEEASGILDPTALLVRERQRQIGHKLYFHTDTHWTHLGAAFGLRQLITHVFPNATPPEPHLSGTIVMTRTDLRNMLLLKELEEEELLDPQVEAELGRFNNDPPGYKTVVLGDSFYERIRDQLGSIFPASTFVSLESKPELFAEPIATADRLIVNTIERSLPVRASTGILSRGGAVAEYLLKRNMARAVACSGFAAIGFKQDPHAPKVSLKLPTATSGQLHCLRIEVGSKEAGAIDFQFSAPGSGAPVAGRKISIAVNAGPQVMTLIVPGRYAGGAVNIWGRPGSTIIVSEVGTIAQPTGRRESAMRRDDQ